MAKKKKKAVELKHVYAGYGEDMILQDVTVSLDEGEFLGVIGPNGGGKTTMLKVLLGLLPPIKGHVHIFGHEAMDARRLIGYVPQYATFDRQFPIDVWNVVLMGRLGKLGWKPFFSPRDKRIARDALRKVDMLKFKKREVSKLSGGQIQRVFIARALATEPKLLLLDEPTASVDKMNQESIFELLRELNKTITIILVSHDVGFISSYVKKIACLNRFFIYHDSRELTPDMLEAAYECPIDIIAHGHPHRVLPHHRHPDDSENGGAG